MSWLELLNYLAMAVVAVIVLAVVGSVALMIVGAAAHRLKHCSDCDGRWVTRALIKARIEDGKRTVDAVLEDEESTPRSIYQSGDR